MSYHVNPLAVECASILRITGDQPLLSRFVLWDWILSAFQCGVEDAIVERSPPILRYALHIDLLNHVASYLCRNVVIPHSRRIADTTSAEINSDGRRACVRSQREAPVKPSVECIDDGHA